MKFQSIHVRLRQKFTKMPKSSYNIEILRSQNIGKRQNISEIVSDCRGLSRCDQKYPKDDKYRIKMQNNSFTSY